MSSPRLIVGLGNPGAKYRDTRHNLGFRLIERLRERWALGGESEQCRSRVWRSDEIVLAQPQTYMNRSGWAVECLVDAYAVTADRLLVAFDDIALPLGALRLRPRGGPGGHRGLESVIDSLRSEEVPRLRLGIAPEAGVEGVPDLPEYVLAPFAAGEGEAVETLLERAVGAAEAWRQDGIEAAMNRWNG